MAHSPQLGRILALGSIVLLVPAAASAYIDPGTGSFLLQMLLAALLGFLFTLRLYWSKVKSFLRNLFGGSKKSEAE